MRHDTYAAGLAGRDEITSTIGREIECEDGIVCEVQEREGLFYRMVAIDSRNGCDFSICPAGNHANHA